MIPQGYPLWVAYAGRVGDSLIISDAFLVIGWEIKADTSVPDPISTDGGCAGSPAYGLTREEALSAASNMKYVPRL